jgi:hypothetical protein
MTQQFRVTLHVLGRQARAVGRRLTKSQLKAAVITFLSHSRSTREAWIIRHYDQIKSQFVAEQTLAIVLL